MDYYSAYNLLLSYSPKELAMHVLEYIFVKCADCNDSYFEEYYECACETKRCIHHHYIKVYSVDGVIICNKPNCGQKINPGTLVRIPCIVCGKRAEYGFRDRVCYCFNHSHFVKWTHVYGALHKQHQIMSLYDEKGISCSFCKKKYLNVRSCLCKNFCSYCFLIHCWIKENNYVCNDCDKVCSGEYNVLEYGKTVCHFEGCNNIAIHVDNGIILWCDEHTTNTCVSTRLICYNLHCYKVRIDDKNCYYHASNKEKRRIEFFAK